MRAHRLFRNPRVKEISRRHPKSSRLNAHFLLNLSIGDVFSPLYLHQWRRSLDRRIRIPRNPPIVLFRPIGSVCARGAVVAHLSHRQSRCEESSSKLVVSEHGPAFPAADHPRRTGDYHHGADGGLLCPQRSRGADGGFSARGFESVEDCNVCGYRCCGGGDNGGVLQSLGEGGDWLQG